jgi:hypothetical protein
MKYMLLIHPGTTPLPGCRRHRRDGQLDRWLSYGVFIGRFARGRWYHVPAHTAAGLRRATVSLKPLRLTRAAVRRSR